MRFLAKIDQMARSEIDSVVKPTKGETHTHIREQMEEQLYEYE